MERIRDLCELARDVNETIESLIRFAAQGELTIYVIAKNWKVSANGETADRVKGPVELLPDDLYLSLNSEFTTVTEVKRPNTDDAVALKKPRQVGRGAHFVTQEEAERFCRIHALTLKSSADTPPYLNPNHDFYATELATAVEAWMALFADGTFEPKKKTPRQHIVLWLMARKPRLDESAEQRIATLVNPDTKKGGGSPRTLAE